MRLTRAPESKTPTNASVEPAKSPTSPFGEEARGKKSESGIALFMVISAMSILSVLCTEFVYIAQMNQTVAFDGLDQLKAHYLAKSGFKLSLLRLKAYVQVKSAIKSLGGGAGGAAGAAGVSKSAVDKVWSFPFFFPIPTDLPGLSGVQKDSITKFQKASGLEGNFSAIIESESSKYNLNSIHAAYLPSPTPSSSPSPTPPPPANGGTAQQGTPNPAASFDPAAARQSLQDYLQGLLDNKFQNDQPFAEEYRDWKIADFMDNLVAWGDLNYERKTALPTDAMTTKGAPFYSLTELHMIPGMEDRLYDLFAPALTVAVTPGINVNTMQEPTLHALIPQITPEETTEFFKFRDSEEQDNTFKDADAFFSYVGGAVQYFVKDPSVFNTFKAHLQPPNARIVVDESEFKITVQATVNHSTRTIQAWVTLNDNAGTAKTPANGQPAAPALNPSINPNDPAGRPDSGLRITFMRII